MSLNAAFTLLLNEYPIALRRPFSGDEMAKFIRQDISELVRQILGSNSRYVVQGSPGKGNWARSPWIGVFDRLITESAHYGYYIVYLVREDFEGLYLSLNQGVTALRSAYGSDAKSALRVRANDYASRLGDSIVGLDVGGIDLAASGTNNLSAFYEAGSICSVYYPKKDLPRDESLEDDLVRFVRLYFDLVSREAMLVQKAEAEEDEVTFGEEDLTKLREHKRIERNRKLAQQAKKIHGYVCMACGFSFEEKYREIGFEFIEAHHLVPLSGLKGQRVQLDPEKDFAVLCSNCHRMIHKTILVDDLNRFKNEYLV
jgi:5-methylcytosine-specific restriction protein A